MVYLPRAAKIRLADVDRDREITRTKTKFKAPEMPKPMSYKVVVNNN